MTGATRELLCFRALRPFRLGRTGTFIYSLECINDYRMFDHYKSFAKTPQCDRELVRRENCNRPSYARYVNNDGEVVQVSLSDTSTCP